MDSRSPERCAPRRAAGALFAFRAALALGTMLVHGCTDPGVVGAVSDCAVECDSDEMCHAALGMCIECLEDRDCEDRDDDLDETDELDDLEPYCVDFECEQCRDSRDCPSDSPRCIGGSCLECEADVDCGGAGGFRCERNRCVAL